MSVPIYEQPEFRKIPLNFNMLVIVETTNKEQSYQVRCGNCMLTVAETAVVWVERGERLNGEEDSEVECYPIGYIL